MRITSLFAGAVCVCLTAGCASSPSIRDGSRVLSAEEAAALYEGDPEVVFATEFPVASADDAVSRGDRALREGKTELALYMYVRAFDLDSENDYALMRIGQIHESRGKDALAAKAYATVLRFEPEHAHALQSLGLTMVRAGRHAEALPLLERAVAADPTLWRAHNGIGIIADLAGEHASAIAAYDQALAHNPSDGSLHNNRGYSYYLNGDYPEAARDLGTAAALGVERAWANLGLVLARQSRYEEAVNMMSRTEDAEIAYNDVGYIAMRQGDFTVAETYFSKAIQIAPRYFAEAHRNLDELRAIKGSPSPVAGARFMNVPPPN